MAHSAQSRGHAHTPECWPCPGRRPYHGPERPARCSSGREPSMSVKQVIPIADGIGDPQSESLPAGPSSARAGHAFDSVTQPDTRYPEKREDSSENIHNGYYDAGQDNEYLKNAAAGQGPPQVPAGHGRQRDGEDGRQAADQASLRRRRVLKLDGRDDRQRDHDRLQDQHGGAEAPHPAPSPVSSSRASPAVTTEPVISIAVPPVALPGPAASDVSPVSGPLSPAVDSSARLTAISMASSSRSAVCTRSGPNTSLARSASCSGAIDRAEEFAVTTTAAATGSSWSRIPATSLSALTARTAISSPNPNDSVSACAVAVIPPGLWAESIRISG